MPLPTHGDRKYHSSEQLGVAAEWDSPRVERRQIGYLPALLTLLATLTLLPLFVCRHVQGETPLFAADLARKVADGRLGVRAQACKRQEA